jgi:predicted nucleic acid-binding protein
MPIVDTSIVLTVLLNAPLAKKGSALLTDHEGFLHAPDILTLEVANAAINLVRGKRLDPVDASRLLHEARILPITMHPTAPLMQRALDISLAYQRRPYDGVFLALAEFLDDVFLTADMRLVNGLSGTPLRHLAQGLA